MNKETESSKPALFWLCPGCGETLAELSACGATQWFCRRCRTLVSRSKRIPGEATVEPTEESGL